MGERYEVPVPRGHEDLGPFAKDQPPLEIAEATRRRLAERDPKSDDPDTLIGTVAYLSFTKLSPGAQAKCKQRYRALNAKTREERFLQELAKESRGEGRIGALEPLSREELINNFQQALREYEDDKKRATAAAQALQEKEEIERRQRGRSRK